LTAHSNILFVLSLFRMPIVGHASPAVWNPDLVKDIKRSESVQRRFTKRLPGMTNRTYRECLL